MSTSTRRNLLAAIPLRAARWSATHPWRAILGWLAFVAIAVGFAVAVPTVDTTDADYRLGESGRASAMVDRAGLASATTENVLINPRGDAPLDRAAATSAAAEIRAGMLEVKGVEKVSEPQWNPDRSALLIAAQLAKDREDATPLQKVTSRVQADHPTLQIREAGDLSIDAGIDERVGEDLSSAEGISLPVTLVLMLLAFGALIAAGIPVLLAATSVAATIGLIAPLSHLVHAEGTVSSMIVLIGMAVGVDYSLFYLKREREERAAGRNTLDAVEIAAQTSGHSIIVSGSAVIASMAGLFV
ncbi:MAG: MMPL family transporter, partial [Marmoricola sp.]